MREVTQYIATDGTVFDDKSECLKHEMALSIEMCTECAGKKGDRVDCGHGPWGETEYRFVECRMCKGTGVKDSNWDKRKMLSDQIKELQMELERL